MIFQTAGSNATQIIKDIEALLEDVSKDFLPVLNTVYYLVPMTSCTPLSTRC